VRKLVSLRIPNVTGLIIGKALYKGHLDLAAAIRIAGE